MPRNVLGLSDRAGIAGDAEWRKIRLKVSAALRTRKYRPIEILYYVQARLSTIRGVLEPGARSVGNSERSIPDYGDGRLSDASAGSECRAKSLRDLIRMPVLETKC